MLQTNRVYAARSAARQMKLSDNRYGKINIGITGALVMLLFTLALAPLTAEASAATPETVAQSAVDDSEQAQTVRRLLAIRQALEDRRERLRDLLEQLENAEAIDQQALRNRIAENRQIIGDLTRSFENIAVSGANLRGLQDQSQQQLSWNEELMQIARPLLDSLKEATEKPRRIEELRRQIELYQQQAEVSERAVAAITRFDRSELPPAVAEGLTEIASAWRLRQQDIARSLEISRADLASLQAQDVDLAGTISEFAKEFILGRGLTLLIALLTGFAVWFALRSLRKLVDARRRSRQDTEQAARIRLLFYAYHLFTLVLVALAVLSVFYVRGDLLLLSLAIIALVMLALGAWRYLPRYVEEGRLLLNVGAAREGERVIYNGLPFRISSLNLYSELRNPELEGVIRLPLSAMAQLISRPRGDDSWFPCRAGDYLLLADGSFAHVLQQSIEQVRLKVMGSIVHIGSADLMQQPLRNLSREGFGIAATFGIDYQHQPIALKEVPKGLHEGIRAAFTDAGFADGLKDLQVEFKAANASSLDYLIYASMNGESASSYFAIGRLIQQSCVDICNQQGWGIPFTQITLHQADVSGTVEPAAAVQPD